MVLEVLAIVAIIVLTYIISLHIAWVLNYRDLKRRFGKVPYNWRILGYTYLYPQYLERLQRERANTDRQLSHGS